MALPEKKGSAISQLEGLLDLLMDLQNSTSTEATSTDQKQEAGEAGGAGGAGGAEGAGEAGEAANIIDPSTMRSNSANLAASEADLDESVASSLTGNVQFLNQRSFNTTPIQSSDLTVDNDTQKQDTVSELSPSYPSYLSHSDNQESENSALFSSFPSLNVSQVNGTSHQNPRDYFTSEETQTLLESLSTQGSESLFDHPTATSSSSQDSNSLPQTQPNQTFPNNVPKSSTESKDNLIPGQLVTALEALNQSPLEPSGNGALSSRLTESDQPSTETSELSPESSSQLQHVPENSTHESIVAYDYDAGIEDEFERLQKLLLTPDILDSQEGIELLKEKFSALENQIYDPTNLIKLLLPLITQILSLKIAEAREEMASAIAPIVDQMIEAKTKEDKEGICSALAPIIPSAVNYQILSNPGEFARAIAPEMSAAIKEQIEIERDAMVDALYPVMGGTFYKYLSEAMRAIDQKVENSLSPEGIARKIRAKSQGISEAELIFKESMPFTIQAIFLIHKASGLVIAEVQPFGKQRLESEMVAGMLTAIRSFVNDCIIQSGEISELDRIEYGHCDILLEVAGYCYLAVVTQGDPPQSFTDKIREALSTIVLRHGKAIELFDGDPDNVPEQIPSLLDSLTLVNLKSEQSKRKVPVALLTLCAAVFGLIFIPWGIHWHRSGINQQLKEKTTVALASDPELAVYRLNVQAQGDRIKLSGKLPNQYLVEKAGQVAQTTVPKGEIENDIIAIKVPPDPVEVAAEVERVTAILNQTERLAIWTHFKDGQVTVEGSVIQVQDAQKITEALEKIPGVDSVTNTVQLQPLALASRIYFDLNSAELKSSEQAKMEALRAFLKDYPNQSLRVIGHSDPSGTPLENQELALERAKTVAEALVRQGIDARRLEVSGTTKPPTGLYADEPHEYSRFVEFEAIAR